MPRLLRTVEPPLTATSQPVNQRLTNGVYKTSFSSEVVGNLRKSPKTSLCIVRIFIIKRKLHGRLKVRNFSSRVERYFTSERSERMKYLWTREEKFCISARPVTSSIFNIYFSTFLHYFLQTSSNNVQEIIESKVEKRTKGKPRFISRPFIISPLIFSLSHSQLISIIILVSKQILLFSVLFFTWGNLFDVSLTAWYFNTSEVSF